VTSGAHPFFTLDIGSATVGGGLVARIEGRWRLLASAAVPAGVGVEPLLRRLAEGVAAADANLLGGAGDWREWARVESRTGPPPRVVVAGPSDRAVEPLLHAFATDGWQTTATVTPERAAALDAAVALRDPDLALVVVAAPEGAGGREREALLDVAALIGAMAGLREDLPVLVAGSAAASIPDFPPERIVRAHGPADAVAVAREAVPRPCEGREGFIRSIVSLAAILDLRIEGVDVGFDAGTRVLAGPDGLMRRLVLADAALVPPGALEDQRMLDAIARWSPLADDAYAVRDRLRNLRIAPWRDAAGDGARLRLAAARAALDRLQEAWQDDARERGRGFLRLPDRGATGEEDVSPDLVIASGGAFAAPPGPAVALALVDTLRRPGAVALTLDHARILGPLGVLDDESDRRRLLADLVDDVLLPLGSAIVAPGLRPARRGSLRVTADGATTTLPLTSGAVQVVDLPPGLAATAELDSPDDLYVGARARRVAFSVTGGLGGLLVDTRDIPLRLPERPERRREYLDAWQRPLWTNAEP